MILRFSNSQRFVYGKNLDIRTDSYLIRALKFFTPNGKYYTFPEKGVEHQFMINEISTEARYDINDYDGVETIINVRPKCMEGVTESFIESMTPTSLKNMLKSVRNVLTFYDTEDDDNKET